MNSDCEESDNKKVEVIKTKLEKAYKPKQGKPLITVFDDKVNINTKRLMCGKALRGGMEMTKTEWTEFKDNVDKINAIILNTFN